MVVLLNPQTALLWGYLLPVFVSAIYLPAWQVKPLWYTAFAYLLTLYGFDLNNLSIYMARYLRMAKREYCMSWVCLDLDSPEKKKPQLISRANPNVPSPRHEKQAPAFLKRVWSEFALATRNAFCTHGTYIWSRPTASMFPRGWNEANWFGGTAVVSPCSVTIDPKPTVDRYASQCTQLQ